MDATIELIQKNLIVYSTKHEGLIGQIASEFGQYINAKLINVNDFACKEIDLADYEVVGVGLDIHKGRVSSEMMQVIETLDFNHKKVFAFSTCEAIGSAHAEIMVQTLVEKQADVIGRFLFEEHFDLEKIMDWDAWDEMNALYFKVYPKDEMMQIATIRVGDKEICIRQTQLREHRIHSELKVVFKRPQVPVRFDINEPWVFKWRKKNRRFEIGYPLSLKFNDESYERIDIVDPKTGDSHWIQINRVYLTDVWSQMEARFKAANMSEWMNRIEKAQFAVVEYETDADFTVQIFTKMYLDAVEETPKSRNGAVGVIMGADKPLDQTGNKLKAALIQTPLVSDTTEVEIEIYYGYMSEPEKELRYNVVCSTATQDGIWFS